MRLLVGVALRFAAFFGVVLLFWAVVGHAQQPLTSSQQCTNHVQELVLADISWQEIRARCGNIMRQAYELEGKVKVLTEELEKEKAAHQVTKEALVKLQEARGAAKLEGATLP